VSGSIPLPVWTHGVDPEGAEYYSCPDPTDPTMRVTVTSMAIYGRRRWHVDYVGSHEWWWTRDRRWSLPHGSTAQEAMRHATVFLYGSRTGTAHFAEWVWREAVAAGGVPGGE